MLLDRAMHLLDGTNVLVTGDVADIGRRINEGDPTCGWVGDPSMSLVVDNERWVTDVDGRELYPRVANPYYGWFEVWGVDARGNAYLATRSPTCNAELLRRLADAHWSRGNPFDRLRSKMVARSNEVDRQRRDHQAEVAEKLQSALRRDIGAYEGGLTRMIY